MICYMIFTMGKLLKTLPVEGWLLNNIKEHYRNSKAKIEQDKLLSKPFSSTRGLR